MTKDEMIAKLTVIREAARQLLEELAPPPAPSSGCQHKNKQNVAGAGPGGGDKYVCVDCGKEL